MKIISKILIVAILFISSSNIIAQNSSELKLKRLSNNLIKYNFSLDSLNAILDQKVSVINTEKAKSSQDDNKITELLSNTANVTNEIDKTQIEIDNTYNEIDKVKRKLFNQYSIKIDSLKSIDNLDTQQNIEIIKLTEKRLLVSPMIDMLSIPPKNVLDLKLTNDTTSQLVYQEYLTEAQQEVENKLKEINQLRDEIEDIIELNEETEEFLEDVSFDNNFAVYSNPTTGNKTSSIESSADYGENLRANTLDTQTKTFGDILFQFGLSSNTISDIQIDSKDNSGTTNLRDFNKLINVVKKQLEDYKTLINNKLRAPYNK